MPQFQLTAEYVPTGDQPEAIRQLVEGIENGAKHQTLLGVTGSGKTFTMANVIAQVGRPALVLCHNKTLAAQLYNELKGFFPNNAVEYFVSYYDYYQPEAYIPSTDTYIEKDLAINDEIEKLRLSATSALMSGRKDVVVVSSVSCLYGIGNPQDIAAMRVEIKVGDEIGRDTFLRRIVEALYTRNDYEFEHGNFRVKGDTVDIFLAYADFALRVTFFDDEIDAIATFDPVSGHLIENLDSYAIFPANIFVTTQEKINRAVDEILIDLGKQVEFLKEIGKDYEAKRLSERVNYDLEMIREVGYCSGIENYSRYFDGRAAGSRPFCLLDCFPKDFIMFIDESHVTLPQIHAMHGGDSSRKKNLVEFGFRLPAALDNRPLRFYEWEQMVNQVVFVSATPSDYELEKSEGVVVEQVIRPTGLLDPEIDVRPSLNQIDDLMEEIAQRAERDERVLVTTLTKRMAEELDKYFHKMGIRCTYIHSDIDTLERVQILDDLRKGIYDVLIGVNLLREGIDLPQVSLVAILDADKEGFLRNHRSLTQTAGRAARNLNGKVIMYADKITESMQKTIDETNRRRAKQMSFNEEHNITPRAIAHRTASALANLNIPEKAYIEPETFSVAAEPVVTMMKPNQIDKAIVHAKREMEAAAKKLEFMEAAQWRDELLKLQEFKKQQNNNSKNE